MPRVELQGDLLALADGGRRVDPEDEQGLAHADLPLEGIAHEDQGLDRSAKDILPPPRPSESTRMNSGRMQTVAACPGAAPVFRAQAMGPMAESTIVAFSPAAATVPGMKFACPMKSATNCRSESK